MFDRTKLRPARITSPQNAILKEIRWAIRRGSLTRAGLCIAETFHLLDEALRSQTELDAVLVADSARPAIEAYAARLDGVKTISVPDELFGGISATETNQGVMALVRPPPWELEDVFRGQALVIVLDGIQDPGNAGAILRAAEAFGATGALFLKGSVNPHNPKAVRASAGSIFRFPVVAGVDSSLAILALVQREISIFAAVPRAEAIISGIDLRRPCALVIGSESRGVSPSLSASAIPVSIPTRHVESLNASVAAGVLLYEASRQRRAA